MKKACAALTLQILLALFICTPVMAAMEYGVIYDETESLGSHKLTMQGEQTLPQLSQTLGLDLRVDVLTQSSYDRLGDAVAGIYEEYDYGYGEQKEGITLTILLEPQDEDTYRMVDENDWCVYARLSDKRGSGQELSNAVYDAVQPYMAARAWNGEDITMSAVALTQAVDAMAETAEDYILTNCPPVGSGEDVDVGEPAQDSVTMQYVFDVADLLPYEKWKKLEDQAESISQKQDCGVYFALVNDYKKYGNGSVYEVTYQLYHSNQLGMGSGRDGILVLLSMAERDYAMFVYGEYAEYAFDEYGQEKLEEQFLGDFGRNDWYGGISNYLDACEEYLMKADAGKPVRRPYWIWFIIATVCSCLAAGAVCLWLLSKMKSVHQKAEANAYLTAGGLHLTKQYDRHTHTTETRTKIQKESSDGGGSTYSESGGGGSGRSGKF